MKYPLISVIIPCYNEEKFLPKTLKALKSQTYPNFEIVVIDNNCTDKTAQIAKKAGARVVIEKEQGMVPARQRGFKEAKGEIIARTDADTTPSSDWLSRIYESFQENPDAIAVFGPAIYTDKNKMLMHLSHLAVYFLVYALRLIMGHNIIFGPNNAIKRKVAQKIKPHLKDKDVHEDFDTACHISCYGKIIFIPSLHMHMSARRFDYAPFFIFEYTWRLIKTYLLHHPSHKLHKIEMFSKN